MKDRSIRDILKDSALKLYIDDPKSKVVDEMKLPAAKARIDIAVVNGHLHGYEIKGSSDTLKRLPSQIIAYSKVFDYLTIVTEERHYKRIPDLVPSWVGLSVCSDKEIENKYSILQPPVLNETVDPFFVSKLLWYPELKDLINECHVTFKGKNTSWAMCEHLASHFETKKLLKLVREKLKIRKERIAKVSYPIRQYGGFGLFAPTL